MTGPIAPHHRISKRWAIGLALATAISLAVLYGLLPQLAGLDDTWRRIAHGSPWWLGAGLALELLSFASYVVLFRWVFAGSTARIGWRASFQISLAGFAANRLLPVGGSGGIVLTVWALRRLGLRRRELARDLIAMVILVYAVYVAALLVGGIGLRTGLFEGPAPAGLTLLPAALGAAAIALAVALAGVPPGFATWRSTRAKAGRSPGRWARRLTTGPVTFGAGVRRALELLRTGDPRLTGAVGWWAFDIAVLWASLAAFGDAPAGAVVVMAYFVGMLGNLLPVPGGVGGVEGGMIAALIGFEVDPGLAIVGVLTYRALAFWLPTLVGVGAYVQLVRAVHRSDGERSETSRSSVRSTDGSR